MYAVLTTGGKQYRVEAGSTLVVEKLAGDPGSSVTFDRVLLVGDGETVTVGTPTVEGASVRATVLGGELGPKVVVFKFKQKVKYRRRTGHRQHFTRLHIDAITADGRTVTAEERKPARPSRSKAAATKAAATKAAAEKADVAAKADAAPETAKAPARRSRARTATKAQEPAAGDAAAEKKPRTPARSTTAAKASSAPAEDAPRPRARRSAKPKVDPAKEE